MWPFLASLVHTPSLRLWRFFFKLIMLYSDIKGWGQNLYILTQLKFGFARHSEQFISYLISPCFGECTVHWFPCSESKFQTWDLPFLCFESLYHVSTRFAAKLWISFKNAKLLKSLKFFCIYVGLGCRCLILWFRIKQKKIIFIKFWLIFVFFTN